MLHKNFLDDDVVLTIRPQFAALLGLNESVVVQQLHYWLRKAEKGQCGRFVDGHYWVWNNLSEWLEQFPFFSDSTLKRIFANLKKNGIIHIEQFDGSNRTNFYRIDYENLDKFLENAQKNHEVKMTSCGKTPSGQNDLMEEIRMTPSSGQNDLFLHTKISSDTSQIWGYNAREEYLLFRMAGEGIKNPIAFKKTVMSELQDPTSDELNDFVDWQNLMSTWPKILNNLYDDFCSFGHKNRKKCKEIATDHVKYFGVNITPIMFEIAFYESCKIRQGKGVV